MDAKEIIKLLNLKPLPREGGFYRETYRSDVTLSHTLPHDQYTTGKSAGTAIYYLVTPDSFSHLHRLPTDEIYHFYLGDQVQMLLLLQDGKSEMVTLGHDIVHGQKSQAVVPGGTWQGSCLIDNGKWALLGTTMAPGFDPSDYEEPDTNQLLTTYQGHNDLIKRLI